MLYKKIGIFLLLTTLLVTAREGFEYQNLLVHAKDINGNIQTFNVKRHIHTKCKNIIITNKMLWTGNYASEKVPEECKSTYVHTTGKLLPMQLDEEVTTYGELEVLAYIKDMQKNNKLMLIDARGEEWFNYRTIPASTNIPYRYFRDRKEYPFKYEEGLKKLGVTFNKDNSLEFKNAKTVTIFCNGAWCSQSVWLVQALLEIDYPADKINWYRGGMQNWLAAGMTSTRD